MLRGYSGTGIFDGDFRLCRADSNRDQDCSAGGSEVQCIFHKIAHRPAKEHGIGINLPFTGASDSDVVLLSEWFIEGRDFLDSSTSGEKRLLDMPFSGFGTSKKKEVVHDRRKSFAFSHARFDDFPVLLGGACSSQADFPFAADVGNGSAEFVGKIGGKLRESRKGILEPIQHFVESYGKWSKLTRPSLRRNAFME